MKINKKLLTYGIIAVILLVLVIVQSCSNKSKTKQITPQITASISKSITLNKVLNDWFDFTYLLPSGDINLQYTRNGTIFRFSKQTGELSTILGQNITGTRNIIYSTDGDQAIIQATDSSGVNKNTYYNLKTGSQAELNKNITSIVWTKENKIIYSYFDENSSQSNLSTSNPDGSNWSQLIDLAQQKIYNSIISLSPDGKKIAFYMAPEGYGQLYIYLYDIASKKVSQLSKNGYDEKPVWSPDSSKLIYEVLDSKNFKPTLWTINADGTNNKSLKIPAFSDKTVWLDNSNIFFAYDPNLPDNYLSSNTYQSNDTFWTYNLDTQAFTKITTDTAVTSSYDFLYDSQLKTIYFLSGKGLYSFSLK